VVGVLRGGDAMIPKRLKMSFHSSYWQALRLTPPLNPPDDHYLLRASWDFPKR